MCYYIITTPVMHIYVYIHTSLFLYISHINIRTAIILQMQTYVQLQSELLSIFSMLVSMKMPHIFSFFCYFFFNHHCLTHNDRIVASNILFTTKDVGWNI